MKYTVCLLTSPGRDTMQEAVKSFDRMVRPRASEAICVMDGRVDPLPPILYGSLPWRVDMTARRTGFCKATARLWKLAAGSDGHYIFWLEDDFVFTRPIDLRQLATVMEYEPQVKQMALYRNPVSQEEIEAGGYIAMRGPDTYTRRGYGQSAWFEHRVNWTTNPSLFRRSLARQFTWPTMQHCEGHFGIGMLSSLPDATFGIWGAGDPWVQHIGERVGTGY